MSGFPLLWSLKPPWRIMVSLDQRLDYWSQPFVLFYFRLLLIRNTKSEGISIITSLFNYSPAQKRRFESWFEILHILSRFTFNVMENLLSGCLFSVQSAFNAYVHHALHHAFLDVFLFSIISILITLPVTSQFKNV